MLAADPGETDWLSFGGDVRRDKALTSLLGPREAKAELVLFGPGVDNVDVVTGSAARLVIARQQRVRPDGRVLITPPTTAAVAERYLELLSPLPAGVAVTDAAPAAVDPPRYALLPATPVADYHAVNAAAEFSLEACDRGRISVVRANLVAWAVAELAENALVHAERTDDPPVVAMTVSGRERILEVAVTDLGRGLCDDPDVEARLRALPGLRGGLSALSEFLSRGTRRGIQVSLEIYSGTGQLRWTQMRHRTSSGLWVPGTTVVARITR